METDANLLARFVGIFRVGRTASNLPTTAEITCQRWFLVLGSTFLKLLRLRRRLLSSAGRRGAADLLHGYLINIRSRRRAGDCVAMATKAVSAMAMG